jgi:hypothetical protein
MEHLKSYASGDGALSLVWCDGDISLGRPVTKEDVINHLVAKENRHLYDRGWRPMTIEGRWHLVKMYKRVGDERADGTFDVQAIGDEDEDSPYTVKINKDDCFYQKDGTIRIANMFVTFHPAPKLGIFGPQEVKNWNTLGSLKFFLSHEKEIATQFEEAENLKAPALYDETNARRAKKLIDGYAGEDCDLRANVVDVITDLRHLCEKQGYDFNQILTTSKSHYRVER